MSVLLVSVGSVGLCVGMTLLVDAVADGIFRVNSAKPSTERNDL